MSWLAMVDELPQERGAYLVSLDGVVTIAVWDRDAVDGPLGEARWNWVNDEGEVFRPTHWQALPVAAV